MIVPSTTDPSVTGTERNATVVVIGAGQAGLSAAYHLQRRGFTSATDDPDVARTFIVLDSEDAPGGAWRHRWGSLTMATVNGIFDLPGFPSPSVDPREPSSTAVPRYFAAFEREHTLPILRPVTVASVHRADDAPDGDLLTATGDGSWRSRVLVNATGTWTNPTWPDVPGRESFAGRQLHTHDYVDAAEFAGRRVAIVGGGISAIQHLAEVSRVATTFWYTRRPPEFRDEFTPEEGGRETIAKVRADVEAGRPTGSVVSYTGLIWNQYAEEARDRGALRRRPMFTCIETDGVREQDDALTSVDVILWATGFRAALGHLDPLGLRNDLGGITMRGTQVAGEPRVHLIGFGTSQSTVGANRAGRDAVSAIVRYLDR
ncbi:FAD-dependent oxidoreductase [Brooklawnia cerclae]|uniref:Cation diffusion facilitator CzcD-associated flavoprotein CzcO n=1 Tax=Brooklawnia cerclae TaxID=349934 RepID=A0ABX0SKP6_9ACTN|nr:NAD(P)-binding domain-containing protein [Brooklawnia cerclae]NIH57893.1 cation diffusion facilitator CzcD-associated flavoprotein CzcO [Brooklawnia cerclae]